MIRRVVLAAALLAILPVTASTAFARRSGDSPACVEAKRLVAVWQKAIVTVNNQIPSLDPKLQATRLQMLNRQLVIDNAGLAKAKVVQTKECGPSVRDYAGVYNAMFGQIAINFTAVGNGVVYGDIQSVSGRTIDAKSGVVDAQATFPGADCGIFKVFFNAKAGTATVNNLTCTLGAGKLTQTVVAHRR